MLIIYSTLASKYAIKRILHDHELTEIVQVDVQEPDDITPEHYLLVENGMVHWPIHWFHREPPVVVAPVPFHAANLRCMIYGKLNHFDLAMAEEDADHNLKETLALIAGFVGHHYELSGSSLADDYYHWHNWALQLHYGFFEDDKSVTETTYHKAIGMASNSISRAFTVKYYAQWLMDHQSLQLTEELLNAALQEELPDEVKASLRSERINCLMMGLGVACEPGLALEIKALITDCVTYYETVGQNLALGELLLHASQIARLEENFSEALSLITRAIHYYNEEEIPELMAAALLRKATLLHIWAQSGRAQFYKPSLDAYQQALRFFTRENNPDVFAEIQHNLGIIYGEMSAENEQNVLWSAVSASAFKSCLEVYDLENYPAEYARAANNYANALMKYPDASNSDNLEKAIYYYNQALLAQPAARFPEERVRTLLNYLEACWRVNNVNSGMERLRYQDMIQKVDEILSLTQDPELRKIAYEHHENLAALAKILLSA